MNRREAAAIVLLLLALLAIGFAWPAPHAAGDVPAAATAIPSTAFVQLSGFKSVETAALSTPGAAVYQPRTATSATGNSPSPSAQAVPRPEPVRKAPSSHSVAVTGTASTYGPGFAGYLALPAGPGIHVRICGAGGCIDRVSNDAGPVPSLHRVADLDVSDFEFVCGLPWTRGLCRVTVEVLAP